MTDTPSAGGHGSTGGADPADRVLERLRRTSLDGADLSGVNLARATLSTVTCRGANLAGACLAGAELHHVDLTDADLRDADLRGATLHDVDLEGADLTRADLRGADLKGVKASKIRAAGVRLSGATLDSVEFVDADLSDAALDGSEIQEGAFQGVNLEGADLRGLLGTQCTITGCTLDRTDLSGATFETLLLASSELRACTLEGTLFRRSKLQDVSVRGGALGGCVLEQCLGTDPELEATLRDAGAALSLPATVRAWRSVRGNRRIQLATAAVALVAAVGTLVVVLTPRWWPTSIVLSRMDHLQAAAPEGWCDRQVELGAILVGRRVADTQRQLWLLGTAAECHAQAGRMDEAEALYRARKELPGAGIEERLVAHVELGRFFANAERWDEAAAVARIVGEDTRAPSTLRLEALRLQADVLRGRGKASVVHPEWVELHETLAETILAIEPPNADYLHDTPIQLYVLGLHETAERLLGGVDPPVDRASAWEAASGALASLLEAGEEDRALGLLEHLGSAERYGDDVSVALIHHERFVVLLGLQRVEEAAIVRDELAGLGTATGAVVSRFLTAKLAIHGGDGDGALAALEGLEGEGALPDELAEAQVWVRVDAYLLLGREEEAMAALEPTFAAVEDHDDAARLLRAVEQMAQRMERPGLATEMLRRVDNPLVAEMGGGQSVILTALRRRAQDGSLAADDPELAILVAGNDTWGAIQGFDLLREAARLNGDEDAVLVAVRGWTVAAEGERRASFGLWLADAERARGNLAGAAALVEELDLWSIPGEHRGRLYELSTEQALAGGDIAGARGWLDRLAAEAPPLDPWHEHSVVMPILRALESRGEWDALAAMAQEASVRSQGRGSPVPDHEITYTRERIRALVAMGRTEEAETELRGLSSTRGACLARQVEFEAFERAGQSRWDGAALEKACGGGAGQVQDLLGAGNALAERGEPARALAVIEQVERGDLEDHEWLNLVLARERFRAAAGNPGPALEALEGLYPTLADADPRIQVTQTLLDIHTSEENPGALIAAYTRFAGDHPEVDAMFLWEHAATALVRSGAGDRVGELGGDPAWEKRIRGTLVETRIRELMDEGAHDQAWSELEAAAAAANDDGQRGGLVWLSQEVADRGGPDPAHLRVLDTLRASTTEGSQVWQRASLQRAIALDRSGEGPEGLSEVQALLATNLADDVRDGALYTLADLLGRHAEPSSIASQLASLEPRGFPAARMQDARFTAAEGLLRRGEYTLARALLEPLAGTTLDEEIVRHRYHVLVRAHVESGSPADAVDLPRRYPPASGVSACTVDIIVVQALPWDGAEAGQVWERIESGCSPASMTLDEVLYVAEYRADSDLARGLSLIGAYREAASPADTVADRLTLVEARFLARSGARQEAVTRYDQVLDGADEGWLIAEAAASMVAEVLRPDEGATAAQAQAVVERALGRLEPGSHDVRHALRAMVGFHQSRGDFPAAIRWQRKVLEAMPEGGEDRGYEALALVRLDLEANGLSSPTWSTELKRALDSCPAGSGAWRELARVQLATDLARRPQSGVALEGAIRRVSDQVPSADRWNFVAALADDLDWLLRTPELAEEVRQLNDGRF